MRVLRTVFLAAAIGAAGLAGADEEIDYGVEPVPSLRLGDYAAATPLRIPGAITLPTRELRELLQRPDAARPLLFDVLGGDGHDSIPGAIWLPGAGRGESVADAIQAHLAKTLSELTGRSLARPLVFFCTGPRCWLSYNAALRAVALGYREVYWYRGGIEAWVDAGLNLEPMRYRWRLPQD